MVKDALRSPLPIVGAAVLAATAGGVALYRAIPPLGHHRCHTTAVPARELTAADVIEASIVARGGRERIAKVTSSHAVGTLREPVSLERSRTGTPLRPGEVAQLDIRAAMPAEVDYRLDWGPSWNVFEYRVQTSPTVSVTEHVDDWHDITGASRDEEIVDATFDGALRWRELFPKVRLRGTETVDDQLAYAVEMTSTAGRTRTVYFSVASKLPIADDILVVMDELHRAGTDRVPRRFTVRRSFSDFRVVDGIVMPFCAVRHAAGDGYLPEFITQLDRVELGYAGTGASDCDELAAAMERMRRCDAMPADWRESQLAGLAALGHDNDPSTCRAQRDGLRQAGQAFGCDL